MPKISVAQRRKDSAASNPRSENPCVRCVGRLASEGLDGPDGGCHMLTSKVLREDFEYEGRSFSKCHYCLTKGENCFELPRRMEDSRVELEAACVAAALAPDDMKKQEQVKELASDIEAILNTTYMPFADHLFAHSGSTGKIKESGVALLGRSRSNAANAKKAHLKRKREENPSDDELASPKKLPYNIAGIRETAAQRRASALAAEKAARAAARARDRAEAKRIKAKRKPTKAEKEWLAAYEDEEDDSTPDSSDTE